MINYGKLKLDKFRYKLYPYCDEKTKKCSMGIASITLYSFFVFIVIYLFLYISRIQMILHKNEDGITINKINGNKIFLIAILCFILVYMILFFLF